MPHLLEEDDVYEGFRIPKDSVVFALQWYSTRPSPSAAPLTHNRTLNHDPTLHPSPETFNPSRWLDPSYPTYKEPLTHHPQIKNHSGYGWGKRTCIGQEYCEVVHLTMIAGILWACDISKRKDEKGREVDVSDLDYGPRIIVRPNKWELDIRVREKWRLRVLREGVEKDASI